MLVHIHIPFCTFLIWNQRIQNKCVCGGGDVSLYFFISDKLKGECSFDLQAKGLTIMIPRPSMSICTFKESLTVQSRCPYTGMLSHAGLEQIEKK